MRSFCCPDPQTHMYLWNKLVVGPHTPLLVCVCTPSDRHRRSGGVEKRSAALIRLTFIDV